MQRRQTFLCRSVIRAVLQKRLSLNIILQRIRTPYRLRDTGFGAPYRLRDAGFMAPYRLRDAGFGRPIACAMRALGALSLARCGLWAPYRLRDAGFGRPIACAMRALGALSLARCGLWAPYRLRDTGFGAPYRCAIRALGALSLARCGLYGAAARRAYLTMTPKAYDGVSKHSSICRCKSSCTKRSTRRTKSRAA